MPKGRIDQHWTAVTEISEEGVYRYEIPPLEAGRDYTIEFRERGPSGNPQYRISSKPRPQEDPDAHR